MKQVYINLPVSDLERSTAFYEALGFTKNPDFSDEQASSMMWSDQIVVMLLKTEFYKSFIKDKQVIDSKTTSGVLIALTLDTKEAVTKFAETAKQNGGDYFKLDNGVPEGMMFGFEVTDPDGNQWEPLWMSPDFNPNS